MTEKLKEIGRLALRVEGQNWAEYYAPADTMEGAIALGTIRMSIVQGNPNADKHKAAFMDLMREVVADYLEDAVGTRPAWSEPHRAPEHERSGSA